jgi:hypothetical protein
MLPETRALLAILCVGILIAVWMARFSLGANLPGSASTFVLDRWTGTIYLCVASDPGDPYRGGCLKGRVN